MPRSVNPGAPAAKGSQKWLQLTVNKTPSLLDDRLREALKVSGGVPVQWLSPLASQGYVEYRDQDFLDQLELSPKKPLAEFWPARGPMWDGLARIGDIRVLLEAKAHIVEMVSGDSKASAASKEKIEGALRSLRQKLAPRNTLAWSMWNGSFYQYANRLAHLEYLREQTNLDVRLVYIYFLNAPDVDSVATIAEWAGAIKLVDAYMGLGRHTLQRHVHKIFIDVREVEAGLAASAVVSDERSDVAVRAR